jgi:cbb3-type cytochrome oxidase subunit 3
MFVLGKNCPFMTNNKNLGKIIKNQDEEYFLLKFFENNHKCVPFGLLITNINLLLLLIFFFFLLLAVFRFILNKLPLIFFICMIYPVYGKEKLN